MQLNHYPDKLNQIEIQLLEARSMLEMLEDRLMAEDAEIRSAIANNKAYRNDAQRKAAEKEAKADQRGDYFQAKNRVKNHQVIVSQLEIDLKLWRDRFSVAKLEKRIEIAQRLETASF